MAKKDQAPYSPSQARRADYDKPRGYGGGTPGRAGPQVAHSGKGIEKCHCAGKPGLYGEMSGGKGPQKTRWK